MLKNVVVGLVICAATVLGSTRQIGAADRFEVTSIKAVRPTLVDTVSHPAGSGIEGRQRRLRGL